MRRLTAERHGRRRRRRRPAKPPWDPDWISRRFTRLAELSGLPPVRLHDLRHLAATLSLLAGNDIKVVQEELGHSSRQITSDTCSASPFTVRTLSAFGASPYCLWATSTICWEIRSQGIGADLCPGESGHPAPARAEEDEGAAFFPLGVASGLHPGPVNLIPSLLEFRHTEPVEDALRVLPLDRVVHEVEVADLEVASIDVLQVGDEVVVEVLLIAVASGACEGLLRLDPAKEEGATLVVTAEKTTDIADMGRCHSDSRPRTACTTSWRSCWRRPGESAIWWTVFPRSSWSRWAMRPCPS